MYVLAAREGGIEPDVPLIVTRNETVLDASPEVLERGVEIGMPMRRARRIASGVIVAEEPSTVVALHERVWNILAAHTPLLEVLDYHEAVADLNFVLDYFRRSEDGRMLFGGRVSYSSVPPPRLAASIIPGPPPVQTTKRRLSAPSVWDHCVRRFASSRAAW